MVASILLPRYRLRLLIFVLYGSRCGVVGQQKRAVVEVAVRRFGGGETSPRWLVAKSPETRSVQ